jgi:tyrosinase
MDTKPEHPAVAGLTRYQRVQQIMDQAAGSARPSYQGNGAFWHLPLNQLLAMKLYGVQMIAPPGPTGQTTAPPPVSLHVAKAATLCCHGGGAASSSIASQAVPSTPTPGRGARSGLVVGLKGEFPFDGSQFPRLPWGGSPVSAEDIAFIEKWIDDGSPAVDLQASGATPAPTAPARDFAFTASRVNTFKTVRGELKQRLNVEFLDDTQLANLRMVIRELKALNPWPLDSRSYNSWAQIHGDECPHGWSAFLPWHRIYLYQFEQALQDIDASVTLPYWNWASATPEQMAAGYIPKAYQGWLNQAALANLQGKISPALFQVLQGMEGQCYTSITNLIQAIQAKGGAVSADERSLVVAQMLDVNPLWCDLRFPGEFPEGQWVQFHHHYPTSDDIEGILQVDNWRDFGGGLEVDDSFGVLDMDPHNTMHIWIGGFDKLNSTAQNPITGYMLSNLTAALDPIFWAHHANVDRIWTLWQGGHPGLAPDDPSDILAGLDMTVGDSIDSRKLGYEYASATHFCDTDSTQAHALLHSPKAQIAAPVLKAHRRAELRLHNVRQPIHSYAVRVFLNLPQADANTPVENNENYAGYFALFGHGACIGGPGHCDPRPRGLRKFDRRQRQHNDPWDLRLDVTDTVKRLVDKGATNLQVNLVVIGGADQPSGRLQLEGISLRFTD